MYQENDILIMMIVTSGMMLLLSSFFVYVVIRSQRRIRVKQLELFNAVIDAQEKEQERIARDLHDQLGPTLSIIKMQIEAISDKGLDELDKNIRYDVLEQMEVAVNEVRSIAHNLIPKTFTEYGFIKSLEYYILRIKEYNTIQIIYKLPEWKFALERSFEITIFRIIQELFQNTIKHANASVINLKIEVEMNVLQITYSDNGIGMKDIENDNYSKGIGMDNLRKRTDLLGGDFNINLNSKIGFEIFFTFKLNKLYGK
jgi:signal transduction histidine kinase